MKLYEYVIMLTRNVRQTNKQTKKHVSKQACKQSNKQASKQTYKNLWKPRVISIMKPINRERVLNALFRPRLPFYLSTFLLFCYLTPVATCFGKHGMINGVSVENGNTCSSLAFLTTLFMSLCSG